MLGSEVLRLARGLVDIEVLEISRSSEISFDARDREFQDLAVQVGLCPTDWLVNCIGWIPQKASGDSEADEKLAWLLNAELMCQISESQKAHKFNWIQIGTDCVYSGESGLYPESSNKEVTDLYSASKIAGEQCSDNAIFIRSSIIGPDTATIAGLYSWFKSAIGSQPVPGFVNHQWNGVSTTAFAKLTIGIIQAGFTRPLHHNWVPKDIVTKFELLSLFAKELGLPAKSVTPVEANVAINRTLTTLDPELNRSLWRLAGYNQEQSIAELCHEFISIDRQLG